MKAKFLWKDIVMIKGQCYAEEFPISGETDGDETDMYYQIDDFLEAVAIKYQVNSDEIKTAMMDNIEFNPQLMSFGLEDCGCYINGVLQ